MIGKTLGQYKIDALLGAGGMGEVYRAQVTRLGRRVAIKLLPPAMRDDPESGARPRREVQAFAASSQKLPAYNRWRGARDPDLEPVRSELAVAGLIDGP